MRRVTALLSLSLLAALPAAATTPSFVEATSELDEGKPASSMWNAVEFARTQGVVPAPESSHALAQVRREALAAAETGADPVIVVGLSGHGLLELGAYATHLSGDLEDDPLSDAALAEALANVPVV